MSHKAEPGAEPHASLWKTLCVPVGQSQDPHRAATHVAKVVPRKDPDDGIRAEGFNGNLTSGYFARSRDIMPKQGDRSVQTWN